jgi:hypothetical protein
MNPLDAAQRTYAPDLTARGVVVARLSVPQGFERPDGTLDTGPSVLVRAVVVAKRAGLLLAHRISL